MEPPRAILRLWCLLWILHLKEEGGVHHFAWQEEIAVSTEICRTEGLLEEVCRDRALTLCCEGRQDCNPPHPDIPGLAERCSTVTRASQKRILQSTYIIDSQLLSQEGAIRSHNLACYSGKGHTILLSHSQIGQKPCWSFCLFICFQEKKKKESG